MKKQLLALVCLSLFLPAAHAQVTRLSNNTSYDWGFALTNNKIMLRSQISKTIWVYDIAGNSFTQLSALVTVEDDYSYGVMNGKLYFGGRTAAEGIELWISDGTPAGTYLLKDINTTGAADSDPRNGFIVYNNEIYFTANDGSTGRELWKSSGTGPGTVRVKDINPGVPDGFSNTGAPFSVINNTLVFAAITATDGYEPWKSDGTEPGTTQLRNIYTTAGEGSGVSNFTQYGTDLIFTAFDEINGDAIWKTNGTTVGTILVKDINPFPPFPPPFLIPTIFPGFFNFQDELYFTADDGTTGYELWKTNGTTAGTILVKDIDPGFDAGFPLVMLAVKNSSKFFFSATTFDDGTELWESDGTGPGTQLLKDIAPGAGVSSDVFILPNFFSGGLFQGDKFFLVANTPEAGTEYYVSNGTAAGTVILKDINPGPADGYDDMNTSFFFTNNKVFFVADNNTNGAELWQSDGTPIGTTFLADVNALPPSAGSGIIFTTLASNTIFFFATDGDDPVNTDFFRIDGSFSLPLRWISIAAKPFNNDVLISWKTADEILTDHFIIQRSTDGIAYHEIGRVDAQGVFSNSYQFTDINAMKQSGTTKLFYRIIYFDKDGRSGASKIVTVAVNNPITEIRILPNLVINELNLVIHANTNDRALARCMDMEGKIILQVPLDIRAGANNFKIPAGNLPNGTYLLQVINGGSVRTERFLIQH